MCVCVSAGQVIMDKNPGVTCVVNKTNTIDSTYRFFQMEVLAGENNMVAKVRWRESARTALIIIVIINPNPVQVMFVTTAI